MGLIGVGFILAVLGAAHDFKYIRKGGKRSSKSDVIWFLVTVGLVGALYLYLIWLRMSAYFIGYITPLLFVALFSGWELGRWRVRRKNPLRASQRGIQTTGAQDG